jgi:hypothetical protein
MGADYDPLVTSITTRQDFIPLTDLYGYMLSYEQRLDVFNIKRERPIII